MHLEAAVSPSKTPMMRNVKLFSLQIGCAALMTALGTLTLDLNPSQNSLSAVQVGTSAIARSSGGRSGGGSFRRSSPSFGGGSSRQSSPQRQPSYGGGGGYVPVPVPYGGGYGGYGGGYGYQSGIGNVFSSLLVLLILGGLGIGGIMWFLPKMMGRRASSATSEVDNNIFTVSKVQIALYAQARELQAALTELSLDVDTNSSEGLLRLLQESALAMLRNTEYWTHVSASSQIARDALEAEQMVNKLSIEQRRQLSTETLVNVGGSKQRSALKAPSPEEGPAAYIVVTFLVGTAHDKPLFDKIRSVEELKNTLEILAALPAQYLMTFELIWSPQDASDSLTDDELLTEYSDLVQI
jgi:uncharacterized membrane protein